MLLVSCFLGSLSANAQEAYLQEFQQKWKNARAYTLELATAMPAADYDFKPTAVQLTFKQQLLHMAGNIVWLSSTYLGAEQLEADLQSDAYTKDQVIHILEQAFDLAMAAVLDFPSGQLNEQVDFFAGPMSKRQIMTLLNDHVVHHRGQIIVYARLRGVAPPAYRGW